MEVWGTATKIADSTSSRMLGVRDLVGTVIVLSAGAAS